MENPSYYRKTPIVVTERMRRQIRAAVAEIDLAQVAISRRLTPAERARQAFSMIAAAERAAVYRLRARDPELSEDEAFRIIRTIGIIGYERRRRQQQQLQP